MENILGGTEMKRKIISIMLSIAIVITGIQLPVIKKAVLAKENVLNKFDAYYTAHSDNVKDYPAKKSDKIGLLGGRWSRCYYQNSERYYDGNKFPES